MNEIAEKAIVQSIRKTIRESGNAVERGEESNLVSLKTVYLMRGLPSCGKSTTARRLAGKDGMVIETDAFFQRNEGGRENYHFDKNRLEEAREWTHQKFKEALASGISPIVIDRGNGLNCETRVYVEMALEFGYHLELSEPDSPWWKEIRILLKYRDGTRAALDAWARELARLSRKTHGVDYRTIRRWMDSWKSDLSVEEIIAS